MVLRKQQGSAVHFNVWNAIYMVPITFLLWPLQSLSIYGGIPLAELPQYLWDGFLCFSGKDVIGSSCSGAWASEIIFSAGTFFAGVCAVVMVKEGSAAFQWAANVFVVPLSNMIFGIKDIMPISAYQPFTWYIIVGFLLVSLGVLVYGFGEKKIHEASSKSRGEEDEKLLN